MIVMIKLTLFRFIELLATTEPSVENEVILIVSPLGVLSFGLIIYFIFVIKVAVSDLNRNEKVMWIFTATISVIASIAFY